VTPCPRLGDDDLTSLGTPSHGAKDDGLNPCSLGGTPDVSDCDTGGSFSAGDRVVGTDGPSQGGSYNRGGDLPGTLDSSGTLASGGLGANGTLDSCLAVSSDRSNGVGTDGGIATRVRGDDPSDLSGGGSRRRLDPDL
jgi:hypothetical protein